MDGDKEHDTKNNQKLDDDEHSQDSNSNTNQCSPEEEPDMSQSTQNNLSETDVNGTDSSRNMTDNQTEGAGDFRHCVTVGSPRTDQCDTEEIKHKCTGTLKRIEKIINQEDVPALNTIWDTSHQIREILSETKDLIKVLMTADPITEDGEVVDTPARLNLNVSTASTEYMSMPLADSVWEDMAYDNPGMEDNTFSVLREAFSLGTSTTMGTSTGFGGRPVQHSDLPNNLAPRSPARIDTRKQSPKKRILRKSEDSATEEDAVPSATTTGVDSQNTEDQELVLASNVWKKGHRSKRLSGKSPKACSAQAIPRSNVATTIPLRTNISSEAGAGSIQLPALNVSEEETKKNRNTMAGQNVNHAPPPQSNVRGHLQQDRELSEAMRRIKRVVEQDGYSYWQTISFIQRNFRSLPQYEVLVDAVKDAFNCHTSCGIVTTADQAWYNTPDRTDTIGLHDPRNIDPASRGRPRLWFPNPSQDSFYDSVSRNINVPKPKIDSTSRFAPLDLSQPNSGNGSTSESSDLRPVNVAPGQPGYWRYPFGSDHRDIEIPHYSRFWRGRKGERSIEQQQNENFANDLEERLETTISRALSEAYNSWGPLDNSQRDSLGLWIRQMQKEKPERITELTNSDEIIRRIQSLFEESQRQRVAFPGPDFHKLVNPGHSGQSSSFTQASYNPHSDTLEQKLDRLAIDLESRDSERREQYSALKLMVRELMSRLNSVEATTNRLMQDRAAHNQNLMTLVPEDAYSEVHSLARERERVENLVNQANRHLNVDNNLRSVNSAFRRPERNITENIPADVGWGANSSTSRYPPHVPSLDMYEWENLYNPDYLTNPVAGHSRPMSSHTDNHHVSNLAVGNNQNNVNRNDITLNPHTHICHPNNTSSTGLGSGQPALNNLTLNNQIPQPRPRANNYWDNFRSFSRQNLLSSPKLNGPAITSSNTESRTGAGAGSSLLPEELNNQTHVQNNIRSELVVNRNPVGNGSKTHLRSPQFVENIASSKKKNKDQSHVVRINSSATNSSATQATSQGMDSSEYGNSQLPGSSSGATFRVVRSEEQNQPRLRGATSHEPNELMEQINKFLDANIHRPAYVLELLQTLSGLRTDTARQRALSALQELVHDDAPTQAADLDSPPESPVRGAIYNPMGSQHPQQAVVVPFSFNRTDDDINEADGALPATNTELCSTPSTTTSTVTTTSGLRLTRVTRDCTRRGGNVSGLPPISDGETRESVEPVYRTILDDLVTGQNLDSDDGEIHDLMDISGTHHEDDNVEHNENREEIENHERPEEVGHTREANNENADGGNNIGFVPIKF